MSFKIKILNFFSTLFLKKKLPFSILLQSKFHSPMAQASRICHGLQNPCVISNLSKTQQRKSPFSVSLKTHQPRQAFPFSSWGLKKKKSEIMMIRPIKVMASVSTAEKASEVVLQPIREISGLIKLPGSKSLSNRILLLAALSEVKFHFKSASFRFEFEDLLLTLM